MIRAALVAVTLSLATEAGAQAYKQTPVDLCFRYGGLRVAHGDNPTSPLTHELAETLAEARSACEQAVQDRPKEGRLHASLARIRAMGGDAAGALEAGRIGAELGAANAQVLLGVMLAEGQGVPRDYAAAREHFRRAAASGNAFAHFNLGVMLAGGLGMAVDEPDAAAAFRRAADRGDPLSMQALGQRYDKQQAEHWLRKAAERLVTEGVREPLRLPNRLVEGAALFEWYLGRARGGEPWAQAYIGALAESGQWVQKDYAIALQWYRTAGLAGNVPAQWRVARFYNEGRGVPKDAAEARRWSQMHEVKRCEDHERAEAAANACDRFAADRYDPHAVSAGVDSFCMRHFAARAIPACTLAVKQSPSTARHRSQLARAYAHTGRFAEARREAAAAASAGSSSAMILLGVMSQRGLGAEANAAEAAGWYRKAGEAGNQRGAALAGMPLVHFAPATPEQQAEKGDPRAQFNLAARLEQEKKYDEAIKWYARAAAQDFRPAELNLAQMYEKGWGVKQDNAEARRRYRRLSDLGDNEARWRAARLAAADGDTAEALKLYDRLMRDDEYRALLDVGQMNEEGRGAPKNLQRALELYERAADRSPWARAKLGILYLESKNYPKARIWLQRAANDRNAAALNNLGLMHDRGLGGKPDYTAARDLYLRALGAGNQQAYGNLENLFAEGRGAPSGPAAVDWYRRGAAVGITSAMYKLGRIYARGEGGVPRDEKAAVELLMRAAERGHDGARKEAGELLYAMGRDMEAAALGHEGAIKRLAAKYAAGGHKEAEAELRAYLKESQRRMPPPPVLPSGVALDPGPDQSRTIAVRVGGVAAPQGAAMDAGMANVYDIIRWFPETDGKAKAK